MSTWNRYLLTNSHTYLPNLSEIQSSSFLANFARLLLMAAAYVLHQHLRVLGLHDTELASAQPETVILSLFKIAVRVKQYEHWVLLHLSSACPASVLLTKVCQRLV